MTVSAKDIETAKIDKKTFRDMLNSTYNILTLSGLPTLTGQRTLTVSPDLSVVNMNKLFLTYS